MDLFTITNKMKEVLRLFQTNGQFILVQPGQTRAGIDMTVYSEPPLPGSREPIQRMVDLGQITIARTEPVDPSVQVQRTASSTLNPAGPTEEELAAIAAQEAQAEKDRKEALANEAQRLADEAAEAERKQKEADDLAAKERADKEAADAAAAAAAEAEKPAAKKPVNK